MALLKQDTVVADDWVTVSDNEELPAVEAVIVPLSRWLTERDTLVRRNGRLGVRLRSDESAASIADDLDRFDLVALEFPTFKDGRSYSTARLLRERYGYAGELRATGNVLPDQALFLARCGFDSYEVADDIDVAQWTRSRRAISGRYQPSTDGGGTIPALRQRPVAGGSRPQGSCAAYWAY